MNVQGYLLGASIAQGHAGNVLPEGAEDLSTWETSDDVNNTFEDGVNTISFSNGGDILGPDGRYWKNYYYSKVNTNYTIKAYSNRKMAIKNAPSSLCYAYNPSTDNIAVVMTAQDNRYPYGFDAYYIAYYNKQGQIVEINGLPIYMADSSTYGETNIPRSPAVTNDQLKEYLKSADLNGISLSFTLNVEYEKTYKLIFDACTPSGFNRRDGSLNRDIKIVSGMSYTYGVINGIPSDVMEHYEIQFTAGASVAKVTFSFEDMLSAYEITIKIADVEVCEVTG